jgi:hypothetical protein
MLDWWMQIAAAVVVEVCAGLWEQTKMVGG